MLSSSRSSVRGSYVVPAAEERDGDEAADPHDQVGEGQAGQRGQQLAGQHLAAADRFAQQEVRRQFALFDRDQPEAVVAGLDRQAELGEHEDEAVKTQHGGHVHLVQAEGGPQFLGELRQHSVHQRGLVGKDREDGEEEHDEEHQGPATR